MNRFLPYCRPDVGQREIAAVSRAMLNGWLTTGPQTAAFERAFADAAGVKHAVALNSCTAGLHLALAAIGVGPGDEVVTPSLTFAAGRTMRVRARGDACLLRRRARHVLREPRDDRAGLTPATRVIIAMPYAGRPMNIEPICAFARERGITVIEDAAHAAGMLDGGEWAGSRSHAAVYSFYATKNLTTAEGGMLVTNDTAFADRVRRLSLHGMSRDAWQRYSDRGSWAYDILEPGYKYNCTDLASSIGLVQLGRLPEMQRRRDEIAARYLRELADVPHLAFQRLADRPGDRASWCMFVVTIEPRAALNRDRFIEALRERNIGTSVHYIPTHQFTAYRSLGSASLPNTEALGSRIVSLPLYPTMSETDVSDVIEAVRSVCCELKPVPS